MDTIDPRSLANIYAPLSHKDTVTYDGGIRGDVFGESVFCPKRREALLTVGLDPNCRESPRSPV